MTISSVGEYLNIIKKMDIDHSNSYYRGQSSNQYHVSSNLYRYLHPEKTNVPNIEDYHKFTDLLFKSFLDQFPIYSDIHTLKDYSPNELDLLIAAQHYGLITRLIDFSRSPLIALFFATLDVKDNDKCSIIIITNTNNHFIQQCGTVDFFNEINREKRTFKNLHWFLMSNMGLGCSNTLTTEALKEYEQISRTSTQHRESLGFIPPKINSTFCSQAYFNRYNTNKIKGENIETYKLLESITDSINFSREISSINLDNKNKYILSPLPNTARIRNQQGVLLFSNNINDAIYKFSDFKTENIIVSPNCLQNIDPQIGFYRIDIDSKNASEIHKELKLYGITEEFIYPEINSFTKNLPDRILLKMNKEADFMKKITIDDLNNGI